MTINDLTRWAILLMWGSIILLLKWKRGRDYVWRHIGKRSTIGHAYHERRGRKAARFKSPADQSNGE